MLNIVFSILAGVVTTVLIGWGLGYPKVRIAYGILPGIIVMIGVYIYLARKVGKELQALMGRVQALLRPANPMKPTKPPIDEAIELLKQGYKWKHWQIFTKAQIDAQIGTLHFLGGNQDDAARYLENAFRRNWVARAMLGVIQYNQGELDKMKETFDDAVRYNKKEALLWNLYAWCLWKKNQRSEAIDVLNRALEHVENDEKTKRNLKALQNDKSMKMRGWREMWYQFQLERPKATMPHQRHVSKRGIYRGR